MTATVTPTAMSDRGAQDNPYQLLPPLTDDEYQALKADIAEHGIRVPVDVDEQGSVLDGHHRAAIAAELGIDCPTRVVAGLTDEGKRHHALAVNLARRQLTRERKRQLIADEIGRDPSRSDRAIARVVGVDHKTVGSVRRELRGEIPHPGRDVDPDDYSEADIAELLAGVIERRSEDWNSDAAAVAIQVADIIREWGSSELFNMFFFAQVARTMYMHPLPLDMWEVARIWLVPIAQQALLECDDFRRGRGTGDKLPGEDPARITVAVWGSDANDDIRLAMLRGMETKITLALVDVEKFTKFIPVVSAPGVLAEQGSGS